jgi:hypothetical protein
MKLLIILLPIVSCAVVPNLIQHVNQTNSSYSSFSESKIFSINSSDFGSLHFHLNNTLKKSSGITSFQKFVQNFDKTLENLTEERKSFYAQTFDQNLKFIMESAKYNLTFTLGVNAFAHLTSEEFVNKYCGTVAPGSYQVQSSTPITGASVLKNKWNNYTLKNLPKEFDWRKYVQPVINQKTCGSCWAFATMAMIGNILF